MDVRPPIKMSRAGDLGRADMEAFGAPVIVLAADHGSTAAAALAARADLEEMDQACGPGRLDTEMRVANRANGRPLAISPALADVIDAALASAVESEGTVAPTRPGEHWEAIQLNRRWGTLHIPAGMSLDVRGVARSVAADRAATAAARAAGCAVMVSVGGDVRCVGDAPDGGWRLGIAAPRSGWSTVEVRLEEGGLVTAQPAQPSARHAGIIPVASVWKGVTVAADTCRSAYTAAYTAMRRGEPGAQWLRSHELSGRLVRSDSTVTFVGRWPSQRAAA